MSAVSRPLREAKRDAFTQIIDRTRGVTAAGQPLRARRSPDMLRLEAQLPGGAVGLIALVTVKDGLATGQFAIDPAIIVYGGPLMSVLRQLPLRPWSHPPVDAVLCSSGAGSPRGLYAVKSRTSRSIATVAGRIGSTWVPMLLAFSVNWDEGLDCALARPQDVAAPFSTSAAMAFLANRGDRIGEIVAAARTDPWFWDAPEPAETDARVQQIGALVAGLD